MSEVRAQPCSSCPYRKDVPSAVWATEEYEKLRDYDLPTGDQPLAIFACHATPEHLCHGWAVCHTNRGHQFDLLALRIFGYPEEIPEPYVPLFASGNEAADHGEQDIETPSADALRTVGKLTRKYPRLRGEA